MPSRPTVALFLRVDPAIKERAEHHAERLGMSVNTFGETLFEERLDQLDAEEAAERTARSA
jgi:predicted HicB family RNase H-like nuclease